MVLSKSKKERQLACIDFTLILLSILVLIWHQTNRRSCYFGSCRCSMDSAASCGRPSLLSEESSFIGSNESNIDTYFTNPALEASCNGSLALLNCFLYQLPDYTAVVHPKEGVKRMWGEEREKSQFSQPHWWLPYGFLGKSTSGSFNSNYCQHSAAAAALT